MERRVFLAFGGGVAAWPAALRAQSGQGNPVIGVLISGYADVIEKLLRNGFSALGYAEGTSVRIEFRHVPDGNPKQLAQFAQQLVRMKVDVLVAVQTPAAHAAKQATRTIPIVISAGDPVGTGLVASLARPAGNITGYSASTAELGGKILELIRMLLPDVKRVAVLANAVDPFTKSFLRQLEGAAPVAKLDLRIFMMRGVDEYSAAVGEISKGRFEIVIIQPSLDRVVALNLAHKHGLPTVSATGTFTLEGGLMSYSSNIEEIYAGVARYADRILKGAKPADLPVQQPTKFDLRLNLKTARALGIAIPPALLARADRVIE